MQLPSSPLHFNEEFLSWFQKRTEDAWSRGDPNYLGPTFWYPGTRWSRGLTEAEIDAIEKRWNLRFPPDYRLFLNRLHTPDQPCIKVYEDYRDDGTVKLIEVEEPSFYNWQTDEIEIQKAYDRLVDCFVYETQWPSSWGQKPAAEEAQKARLQELINAAPRLIPVYGSRYLLAEPCQEGNPVLSLWPSDKIVFSANFRDYLIVELLQLIDTEAWEEGSAKTAERYQLTRQGLENYRTIPFWGEWLRS